MRDTPGTVYLLHFTKGVPRMGTLGVWHYLGWAREGCLEKRLARHAQPRTEVTLLRELHRLGGRFQLARTWPGETPDDERRRKKNGHIGALCPICRGNPAPLEDMG